MMYDYMIYYKWLISLLLIKQTKLGSYFVSHPKTDNSGILFGVDDVVNSIITIA